jgi:hypothetical protein
MRAVKICALVAVGFVLGMSAAIARASMHLLEDMHEPWNGDGEAQLWRDW